MNRREFMDALERQLQDVPLEDRIDALQYYEDYFEDGGYDKEQDIINELKTPENVANIIKRDLGILKESNGENSENNKTEYKNYRGEYSTNNNGNYNWTNDSQNMNNYQTYNETKSNNKFDKRLILIIIIITFPITIGPVLGFFGALFGIFVAVFGVAFGMYAGGIGCVIGSIALLATGAFADASIVFGVGLILLSIALFVTLLCSFMCRVVIPSVFNGIRKLIRYFRDGEATA